MDQGLSCRHSEPQLSTQTTPTTELASQILSLIGHEGGAATDPEQVGRALRACTREQLLSFARTLGISGVTKLAKDALAGRVGATLSAMGTPQPDALADEPAGTFPEKFDLGPQAKAVVLPQNIPWGYSMDRVTAMPVDPRRLFVYWEVSDDAIVEARKGLGPAGAGAWLCLRVYDITGRLFDGTNAHSYFDEGVDREVRQWFFEIGKPTSTACVEVGLKSSEGYFVKIARSGRVDFPREQPEEGGAIEWLTVRTASGHAGAPVVGGAPIPNGANGGTLGGAGTHDWQGWSEGAGFPVPGAAAGHAHGEVIEGSEWRETVEGSYETDLGQVHWEGPVHRSEWQAGPFSYPVDAPGASILEHLATGDFSMRTEDGVVHVVYGPWQVVIRGVGARAERKVLATWEYRRSVAVAGGYERDEAAGGTWEPVAPGASELRLVGASERRWIGASELLARGGSELYMLGASERLFRGASERLRKGASERMFRGASERLWRGASERRLGGASERVVAGGFGAALGGASEGAARVVSPEIAGVPGVYPTPKEVA